MKQAAIIKQIDQLGRIVIPKEIRNALDINLYDDLEIRTDNGNIIIKKHQPGCVFCGSDDLVTVFHDKLVCRKCIEELSADK